jgi:hypothetical protein
MRRVAAKFVSKLLSPEQQQLHLEVTQDMLECANRYSRHNGSETRMRRTCVTPLHYLAATDASGSVTRQQKIMHSHESRFYHFAQFPHPFAIT